MSPLLQCLDISQEVAGYTPSIDAVVRYEVAMTRPGARAAGLVKPVPIPAPITVTAVAIGKLWGFVPHLKQLVVSNVTSINALPVELLRCPKLQIVTASPELIRLPPPEITQGAYSLVCAPANAFPRSPAVLVSVLDWHLQTVTLASNHIWRMCETTA